MDRGEKAQELFHQGYNCAQALVLAFSDVTGLDPTTAARLTSGFGGGISRMRVFYHQRRHKHLPD